MMSWSNGCSPTFKRQAWPERTNRAPEWAHAFQESRRWCFLTLRPGTEPLKALVETFLNTWQFGATHPERVKHQNGWIELLRDGKAILRDLLDATERRYKELDQTNPPPFSSMSTKVRNCTCGPRSTSADGFQSWLRTVLPIRVCTC
jgi:hypothetical protein